MEQSEGLTFGVNVIRELEKLRSTAYEDPLTWVDEVLQNCQRSGASNVDVDVGDDGVVVYDNGVGCETPNVLFMKNEAGWGADVKSPFGEGLFSVFMAADQVTCESRGWRVSTDVALVIDTGDISLIDFWDDYVDAGFGFRLELRVMRQGHNTSAVIDRFHDAGAYLPLMLRVNGQLVEKKDLSTPPYRQTIFEDVNVPGTTGYLYPSAWGDVEVYHDYRKVCDVYQIRGVEGCLVVDHGVLNLRSPDRKAIINDAKAITWYEEMKEVSRKLYLRVVDEGDDKMMNELASRVVEALEPEVFAPKLRYLIDRDGALVNMMQAKAEEMGDDMANNKYTASRVVTEVAAKVSERTEPIDDSTNLCRITKKPDKTGEKIPAKLTGFFVRAEDYPAFADQVGVAKYHGCAIGIARNDAEAAGFEYFGWRPINEIEDAIRLEAIFEPLPAETPRERRAYDFILGLAEQIGFEGSVGIGKVTAGHRFVDQREKTLFTKPFKAVALYWDGSVILSKSRLKISQTSRSDKPVMFKADLRWLTNVIPDLAHELAHYVGEKDGTVEHAQKTLTITEMLWRAALGVETKK